VLAKIHFELMQYGHGQLGTVIGKSSINEANAVFNWTESELRSRFRHLDILRCKVNNSLSENNEKTH